MLKSDFYYDLPEKLIAQHPADKRDHSRLMVLQSDLSIEDKLFHNVTDYLKTGDCLVLNNTKVIPARLFGKRKDTGSLVEFLLIKQHSITDWEVMVRPGKKCKSGKEIVFLDNKLEAKILDILENGNRLVRFIFSGIWQELLSEIGEMPLPPYITEKPDDPERYQTIYAQHEGSSAAPTAGLHFTNELLEQIRDMGVEIVQVTLHVGIGTFRPVKENDISKHFMHSEYFTIDQDTAEKINKAKKNGGRIIGVGTTSCRVLETVVNPQTKELKAMSANTDIFIYPGYKFKVLDALITNFHLPESTLLMLVSALYGRENILKAYQHAINAKYRFFSFGDAMLILP